MHACEGEGGAEDVEERLDPEGVDEGAVLHNMALLDQDAQEKECEKSVVARHDDAVDAQGAFVARDARNREQDGQHTESNSYKGVESDRLVRHFEYQAFKTKCLTYRTLSRGT